MADSELRTERLGLTPFRPENRRDLHAFFAIPEVRRFLLDDTVMPLSWIDEAISESDRDFGVFGVGMWTLRAPVTDEILGVTGFRHFFEPPQLQVLYALRPGAWGRGLAIEALRAMLQVGFEGAQFDQIVGATDPPNQASIRVMERCGLENMAPSSFVPPLVETGDTLFLTISRDAWRQTGRRVLL